MKSPFEKLLKSDSIYELLDTIVVDHITDSLDFLKRERDRIEQKLGSEKIENEEWLDIVQDIQAMERVLKYYE